eukprot:TRINITY_DN2489_c0_g1_i3.p1 TRINITY_DN2489_c0_g1~~TRINITY_DN2489_c0_g1_i3.p1  ORF type:complete len:115 (+),score=16.86 TRINITY_DN2489_c0_g1_i3:43-387(+)
MGDIVGIRLLGHKLKLLKYIKQLNIENTRSVSRREGILKQMSRASPFGLKELAKITMKEENEDDEKEDQLLDGMLSDVMAMKSIDTPNHASKAENKLAHLEDVSEDSDNMYAIN